MTDKKTVYFPIWEAAGNTAGTFFVPHPALGCETPEETKRLTGPAHIPSRDIRHVVLTSRQRTKYAYVGALPVEVGDGTIARGDGWEGSEEVITSYIGGAPVPCSVIVLERADSAAARGEA